MPKLMVLVACNEVLQDEEGNPSLISVFSALDVAVTEDTQFPPNALAPRPWKAVAIWNAEESEFGKEYVQRVEITSPAGMEFGNSSTPLIIKTRSHNIKINVPGIPIGVEGNIVIKTWLELYGLVSTPKHIYEISIRHRKPQAE